MRTPTLLVLATLALSISAAADRCNDGQCLALRGNHKLPLPTAFDVTMINDHQGAGGKVAVMGFDVTPGPPQGVGSSQSHNGSVSDSHGPSAGEHGLGLGLGLIPKGFGQGDSDTGSDVLNPGTISTDTTTSTDTVDTNTSTAIPEPATLTLLGSGLLLARRRLLKRRLIH